MRMSRPRLGIAGPRADEKDTPRRAKREPPATWHVLQPDSFAPTRPGFPRGAPASGVSVACIDFAPHTGYDQKW